MVWLVKMVKWKGSYLVSKACLSFSSNGVDNIFKVKSNESVINRLQKMSKLLCKKAHLLFATFQIFMQAFQRVYFFNDCILLAYIRKRSSWRIYQDLPNSELLKLYQIQKPTLEILKNIVYILEISILIKVL
jgi:hypothetical protein